MNDDDKFVPFVPAEKNVAEFTVAAVVLGAVLGVIMTSANAYVGLYAGMTVTASIPAAVISMGILRGLLRRGTILENNIVQTIASAGESLAAGIIFTMPAIVLIGVWQDFKFWPVTLIAVCGGLLGVLFMVPLRRTLIIEEKELIYPEGLACAEVLEVGERGGSGVAYIFSAMAVGFVFKFWTSAISIIKGTVEYAWQSGRSLYYFGGDMSVLLVGIGYIVGLNISMLVFLGGAIGWLIGIPLYSAANGIPAGDSLLDAAGTIWSTQIRYLGVGAMIVGGLWSIVRVRHGIARGVKTALFGHRETSGLETVKRTEQDMPQRVILGLTIVAVLAILSIYYYLTQSGSITVVSTIAMFIAGFFFVAVSSYIVGLVGTSNNPVSGMTICTILFASALLLIMGMSGNEGILASLGVAGVVCCAAATAGDISQDLKTGYLVGATPRRQQAAQILGVVIPAFVIAPTLTVLHTAYGIGSDTLPAPQARLFESIARAMFTEQTLPWRMVQYGAVIGIALVVIDEILRSRNAGFRAYVMPVAVGIYLPFSLAVPIFAGGLLSILVKSVTGRLGYEAKATHRGLLYASGLIAGEAIMGIMIALHIFISGSTNWARWFFGFELPVVVRESSFLSLFLMGLVVLTIVLVSVFPRIRQEVNK
jgi:putative OPT family oligopeptide transporter